MNCLVNALTFEANLKLIPFMLFSERVHNFEVFVFQTSQQPIVSNPSISFGFEKTGFQRYGKNNSDETKTASSASPAWRPASGLGGGVKGPG